MFYNKNNFWIGLVIGLAIPVIGYALLLTIFEFLESSGFADSKGLSFNFRVRTLALIGICFNLIPFHLYKNAKYDNSMRGIAVATVIYAMIWFVRFGLMYV
ncbi:MAG: hypothetical protein KBA06_02930 [Saprospiraceae bacterium]|nr:hypothetical protein [Saprospiraceae bacterium]